MAIRWIAAMSFRFPPLVRRWRTGRSGPSPDEAGMSISPSSCTGTRVTGLRALCHRAICSRTGSIADGVALLNAQARCGFAWVSWAMRCESTMSPCLRGDPDGVALCDAVGRHPRQRRHLRGTRPGEGRGSPRSRRRTGARAGLNVSGDVVVEVFGRNHRTSQGPANLKALNANRAENACGS